MNKRPLYLFLIISILAISGCSTSKTTGGTLTEDITSYDTLCVGMMADTCFEGVAMFNQDPSICDNINEEEAKNICKEKITEGQFIKREYTESEGCSFDTSPFYKSCEQICTEKGLTFRKDKRQTIDEPLPLTSIGGFIDMHCQEDMKTTAFMACYCF